MLLDFSTTTGVFTGAINNALVVVGKNPYRKSLFISFNPTTTVGRYWTNATEILTFGFHISTTPPSVLLTLDNVGQLLYEAWWFNGLAGGAVNGVFADSIKITDTKDFEDATRIKPAKSHNWEYQWGIPRTERRPNRNMDILTSDDSLHDIIRRRRRFR
jgi:hypothetical protein